MDTSHHGTHKLHGGACFYFLVRICANKITGQPSSNFRDGL